MPEDFRDNESVELSSMEGEGRTSGETYADIRLTYLTDADEEDFVDAQDAQVNTQRSHPWDTTWAGGQFDGPQMNGGSWPTPSGLSQPAGAKTANIEGKLCHKRNADIFSLTMFGVADTSRKVVEHSQHTPEASHSSMPKPAREGHANGTAPSADIEPHGTYLASQVSELQQQHDSGLKEDKSGQREDYSPQSGSHARTVIVRSRDCRQRPSD